MEPIHNMTEFNESESSIIASLKNVDRELMRQICCYEKLGGQECTIESLKEQRQEISRMICHAQNSLMQWKNSTGKYRETMDFSL